MGLTRSLTAGASSLRAHQRRLDIIANNIANSNTIGYKSSRANFVDQISQVMNIGKVPDTSASGSGSGGINPLQFGLGVRLGSIQMDMSQGILESTNRPLDLALQGDGFFVYKLNGRELFSRAGALALDRDGNLIDPSSGAFIQGYNLSVDANGKIIKNSTGLNELKGQMENLKIPPNIISPPRQTQNISISGNLSSNMEEGDERRTSISIYDNQGGVHTLTLVFTKTANQNEFTIAATIGNNNVPLSATSVTFNPDGSLNSPLTLSINAADLNTAIGAQLFDATTPKNITIKLADPINILSGLTQYASDSTATAISQDGYQSGTLNSVYVDNTGKIWGSFTNGQTELLGQVVIAKFTNQEGLKKEGGNFYSVTPNSGLANIGTAGEIFPSTLIISSALEESNVELTREFTDMISTQRAFEAAARTVTVSDQMLAEVNLLKR